MRWLDDTRKTLLLAALIAVGFGAPAMAQEQAMPEGDASQVSGVASELNTEEALLDPNLFVGIQEAYQHNMALRTPEVQPGELDTLFFTLWQHQLLQEAKRSFVTRRPEDAELSQDSVPENRPRGIRELSLGGIVYKEGDNWTVWLNGQRVTPEAIPKQVMDIRVRKDFIELKWFDAWSNLIYPVRLRPHQRFNLDSRIFLPGTPL